MIDILLIIIFSISLTALVLGCLAYMKNEDPIKSVEMYSKGDNNPLWSPSSIFSDIIDKPYCYSKVAWDLKCGSPSSCPSSAAMLDACKHATEKNITAYLNNSVNPCLGRSSKGDQQLGRTSTDRLGSVPTDDVTRALECKNFLYTAMRNRLLIDDLVADPPPEWVSALTPNEKRNAFAEADNIATSADRQFDRCIAYMQEVVEMDGGAEMGANDPFMVYYNDIMRATDLWASGELVQADVPHDSGPTCPDATNQVCSPFFPSSLP